MYFREGLHTSTLPNPLELSIKYVQIKLCIFRNTKLPFKEKNSAIKVNVLEIVLSNYDDCLILMIMMMHFVIMKKFNILLMKIIVSDIVFFCDVSNYVAFDDHDDELTSV